MMDLSIKEEERLYSAAERQLTILEEKLDAVECGMISMKSVLKETQNTLSAFSNVTMNSNAKDEHFKLEGTSLKAHSMDLDDQANLVEAKKELEEDIRAVLEKQLDPLYLVVTADISYDGSSTVDVFIVSEKFRDLTSRHRHLLVQTLTRSIANSRNRIKNISISKALTPFQYAQCK